MKKYLLLYLPAALISLLLFSCKDLIYSPNGENFVNVQIPNTPLSVDLDNAKDTLLIFGTIDLKYTVNTNGKIFSKVVIYLDSTLVGTSPDDRIYRSFNSESYSSGSHKLRLELWAHSGSGSLADRYGAEFLISTRQWDIFIENRKLTAPFNINNIGCVDGTLRIEWQQYPYRNFTFYEIYKADFEPNSSPYNYRKIATVTDPRITYFTDSTYIGKGAAYYVHVNSFNNQVNSQLVKYYDKPVSLYSVKAVDDQRFEIVWEKSRYYANFKKYELKCDGPSWYASDVVATFNNVSDTTYIDNYGFGNRVQYYIWAYSKDDASTLSEGIEGFTGSFLTSESVSSVQYVPALNSIYLNGLHRLDGATLKTLAEVNYPVTVSLSGKLAVSNGLLAGRAPHSFTMVDPLTLQTVSETRSTDELLGYYSTNECPALSETGLCFYSSYRYQYQASYGPPARVLVRLNPYGLLYKDSTSANMGNSNSISAFTDEGEYILTGGNILYNLKNGQLKKLSPASGVFLNSGKEIIELAAGVASVYRCIDHSPVRSFPVSPGIKNYHIDPATGYLGVRTNDSKFMIYDTVSGRLVKEIKLANTFNSFVLANSILFSTNGRYIKLTYN